MDWLIYIIIVLLIIATVWALHSYKDKIASWVKGGPMYSDGGFVPKAAGGEWGVGGPNALTLSQRVDLMHTHRDKVLEHAAALEADIAAARADVATATSKLLPPATT